MGKRCIGGLAALVLGVGMLTPSGAEATWFRDPQRNPNAPPNHGRHSYCFPLLYSWGTFCHPRGVDSYPPGAHIPLPPGCTVVPAGAPTPSAAPTQSPTPRSESR